MSSKAWMLNREALGYAKECICVVKNELGIKLTLSHPDFINLLTEYTEMLDSEALNKAYVKLISMANQGNNISQLNTKKANIADFPVLTKIAVGSYEKPKYHNSETVISPKAVTHSETITRSDTNTNSEIITNSETITAPDGKDYLRWLDGKEFKGLYRGQPTYR